MQVLVVVCTWCDTLLFGNTFKRSCVVELMQLLALHMEPRDDAHLCGLLHSNCVCQSSWNTDRQAGSVLIGRRSLN